MGTKKFDAAIRDKIQGHQRPLVSAHWESMAALLDQRPTERPLAAFGEETRLDRGIARKLDKIRPVGSPSQHWPGLEQRLRAQDILFERVVLVKSTEVSLFLLLVASFLQWFPVEPARTPQQLPPRSLPQAHSPLPKHPPVSAAALAPVSNTPSSIEPAPPLPPTTHIPYTIAERPFQAPRIPLSALKALPAKAPVYLAKEAEASLIATGSHSDLPAGAAISIPLIASPHLSEAIESLDNPEASETTFFPIRRKPIFNIAMLGGADFNRVMTPPNYAFRTKGFDRYTKGYSGGILLGMEYGRLEAGAGLVYAAKEYQPLPVIFVKGSNQKGFIAESLEGIQLNLVNLPLYLRYDIVRQNKWRAYVSGGGSLQIALYANYFISPPISLPANGQAVVVEGDIQNTTGGWFEGGSFRQNSYVTANVAIGLERFVSERWSVFTQPTYQQSVGYFSNGLGPNLDHIHTLSLWTGIRVRLIE